MERERSSKVIALAALVVGVVGLSIGFAAFSNSLTISSSAEVKPSASKFDVNFSSVNTEELDGDVTAVPSVATINGETAVIDNTNDPTITGLKANFTEPGQSVTYSFYAHNAGEYEAFLKSVTYANVSGKTETKVCSAAEGTSEAMVISACDAIKVTVKVGNETYTGSTASIKNHSLAIDGYEPIVVTITYEANGAIADGDFSVTFGDISLLYSSVD